MSIIQSFFQTSDLFFDIGSNRENLDLKTEIGETLYNSDYVKRVIIPSEVTIGSPTTATAALKIPSGLGGRLLIDNYGSIQGAGGAAGGNGGDAILVQSTCTIENKPTGTIYAGGGGGGTGGTGGNGGPGQVPSPPFTLSEYYCRTNPNPRFSPDCPTAQCPTASGTTVVKVGCVIISGCPSAMRCDRTYNPPPTPTTGGSGSSGGAGGVGRGYNQSPTTGSTGVAGVAGGTNAGVGGAGGTGGSGGDWGTSGDTGNTGATGANGNVGAGVAGASGGAGGSAGNYINGSPLVTFTNTGTIAGSII